MSNAHHFFVMRNFRSSSKSINFLLTVRVCLSDRNCAISLSWRLIRWRSSSYRSASVAGVSSLLLLTPVTYFLSVRVVTRTATRSCWTQELAMISVSPIYCDNVNTLAHHYSPNLGAYTQADPGCSREPPSGCLLVLLLLLLDCVLYGYFTIFVNKS